MNGGQEKTTTNRLDVNNRLLRPLDIERAAMDAAMKKRESRPIEVVSKGGEREYIEPNTEGIRDITTPPLIRRIKEITRKISGR